MSEKLSQMYNVSMVWKDVANSPHVHGKMDSSLKIVAPLVNESQDKHIVL